jgi:hypothetical protein
MKLVELLINASIALAVLEIVAVLVMAVVWMP